MVNADSAKGISSSSNVRTNSTALVPLQLLFTFTLENRRHPHTAKMPPAHELTLPISSTNNKPERTTQTNFNIFAALYLNPVLSLVLSIQRVTHANADRIGPQQDRHNIRRDLHIHEAMGKSSFVPRFANGEDQIFWRVELQFAIDVRESHDPDDFVLALRDAFELDTETDIVGFDTGDDSSLFATSIVVQVLRDW
jgi:hypothetical protein